jgi:DNA repair protein RadD
MKKLYDFQSLAVKKVASSFRSGVKSVALEAPTGAGKTLMAMSVVTELRKRKPSLMVGVVAHRKELLGQAREAAVELNINDKKMTISSVRVAARRGFNYGIPPGLIIIDECHHAEAETYKKLVANNPKALILGLSATLTRLDGKSLFANKGGTFQQTIVAATLSELFDRKILMRPMVFAPAVLPNTSNVKEVAGDYDPTQLARVCNSSRLCGDIIQHYLKHAKGRQALLFAVNKAHAESLRQRFEKAGISAACVFGTCKDRDEKLCQFMQNKIKILINLHLFIEGFDYPPLSCVILACPTKSYVKYMQAVGRAIRTAPGKETPIILDHAGCAHYHGLPGQHFEDGILGRNSDSDEEKDVSRTKRCPTCDYIQPCAQRICEFCGADLFDFRRIEESQQNLVCLNADEFEFYSEFMQAVM